MLDHVGFCGRQCTVSEQWPGLCDERGSMEDTAPRLSQPHPASRRKVNMGALIIRIRFWGPLYYSYNKEPQNSIVANDLGPYSSLSSGMMDERRMRSEDADDDAYGIDYDDGGYKVG